MKKTILLVIVIVAFLGCTNHYNDMVDWAERIPVGSGLEEVKQSQPDYLTVLWEIPDTIPKHLTQDSLSTQVKYDIIKIDGNYDILKMQNLLVFIDGKFVRREARK